MFLFYFWGIKRSHIEYMYTVIYCALMFAHFDSMSIVHFNRTQVFNISATIKSHENWYLLIDLFYFKLYFTYFLAQQKFVFPRFKLNIGLAKVRALSYEHFGIKLSFENRINVQI